MDEHVRARVRIAGRVQGVCFRMETKREADRLGIHGWVKNRRDGTVEAVFEGEESSVAEMIRWSRKGPPFARVTGVETVWETPCRAERFEIAWERNRGVEP